jgi:RNA 2',3'-cyclic 3'-phosphodiesterase
MRYFIALELPEAIKQEICSVQKQLKILDLFRGTYVAADNLHVTLLFLGSLEEPEKEAVIQKMSLITTPPFTLQLLSAEVPSWRPPRVLWVATHTEDLTTLFTEISTLVPEYTEKRPYKGHITLARIRNIEDPQPLKHALSSLEIHPLSWQVTSVSLFQSHTPQTGSNDLLVHQVPLGKNT